MFIKLAASTILLSLPFLDTACGGDDNKSDTSSPATSSSSTTTSITAGSPGSASTARTAATPAAAPASVDVCALFNADDAKAVLAATKSNGTATMTATKLPATAPTLGACKFQFNGTPTGTLEIDAEAGDRIAIFRNGSKPIVPGFGDEAFTNAGTPYLRVGNVMLSAGEDSFSSDFVIEVFRRMAPKMK